MLRKQLVAALILFACTFLFLPRSAEAKRVVFRSNGGHWSHHSHHGWHRYWGGPSIGFYFAAAPVFIVAGYPAAHYYTGSTFWYSNPTFGLRVNIGGGHGGGGRAVIVNGGHGGNHGGGHMDNHGGHGGGHGDNHGGHDGGHGGGGHDDRR